MRGFVDEHDHSDVSVIPHIIRQPSAPVAAFSNHAGGMNVRLQIFCA